MDNKFRAALFARPNCRTCRSAPGRAEAPHSDPITPFDKIQRAKPWVRQLQNRRMLGWMHGSRSNANQSGPRGNPRPCDITAAGLSDQPHSRAPAEDRDRSGENRRKTSPENDQAAGSDQQPKKDAANQPRKPPFYKRPLLMLFLGLGLLVAIVVAVVWWLYARQYESTDDAFIDGHVVTISPNVSATVWAVHVDDNSRIKRGDLLVELDGRDYQFVVEQTKAGLTAAQERPQSAGTTGRGQRKCRRIAGAAGRGPDERRQQPA